MDKKVYTKEQVREQVKSGLAMIAKPVVSTLSPKGHNVLIETDEGNHILTNDGVTIAKAIASKNQIENAVIEIVKEASLRTNAEAGDGTTSTIVLVDTLVPEAFKLLDEGYSWIEVRNELNKFADTILKKIEKNKIIVKNDSGLEDIATTSANNDKEIAKHVIDAIKVARTEGMIFIEPNQKQTTEVIKDLGFMVKAGVMYQELLQGSGRNFVNFKDTPILITDKKLYYSEEAETIMRVAVKSKHKSIVVVAKDFMGDAVNTFIANHSKGVIEVMLVKDPGVGEKDNTSLHDLAVYLGAKVITDKTGSLVNNLTDKDFTVINAAYSDQYKSLFTPKQSASKELKERVKMVKEELEKDKDNETLKNRLASLTTGVVTIKVPGRTPMELREKIYRYEDAVNATRAAIKDGYLVGGGVALLRAFDSKDYENKDFVPMFRKFTQAIVRQIANNCGGHPDSVVNRVLDNRSRTFGYNALTNEYGDLLKAGVVDPFKVIQMAVQNSVSVTNVLISINHFVINDIEDGKEDKADA